MVVVVIVRGTLTVVPCNPLYLIGRYWLRFFFTKSDKGRYFPSLFSSTFVIKKIVALNVYENITLEAILLNTFGIAITLPVSFRQTTCN